MDLIFEVSRLISNTGRVLLGDAYSTPIEANDIAPKGYSDIGIVNTNIGDVGEVVLKNNQQIIVHGEYTVDGDLCIESGGELVIL